MEERNLPTAPQQGSAPVHPKGTSTYTYPMSTMEMPGLETDERGFDPWLLLVYVVRYRFLIISILMLGLLAGWLVTLAMPPKYRSEALIEIAPPAIATVVIKDMKLLSDTRTLKTVKEKLKSYQLLRRVIHELSLMQQPEFINEKSGFSLRKLLNRGFEHLGTGASEKKLTPQELEQKILKKVADNLVVKLKRGTNIISISYSSTNPEYAHLIPNQVINNYIAMKLDQTAEASAIVRKFIAEQVREVKKKLEDAEKQLVDYAKKSGLTIQEKDKEGLLITANKRTINEALSEAIYRLQYQSLIEKLSELNVAAEIQNKSTRIVKYAEKPIDPYFPKLSINLALAMSLSGGLAAGLIFLLKKIHNTFDSPDQLENELKLPVLGLLPKVPEEKLQEMLNDPRSALSEAFYSLRTSLQFTGTDGAPRTLLITSTAPGEGKSTVATKLAEAFGMLGMNVLLMDANMRRPIQHHRADIPNTTGLSNLLTNTVPVSEADAEIEIIRNTPWKNVCLVTAGTLPPNPPNPANLLASQKMDTFIEACRQRFDIIIIDAPPVMGFADALLLSRLTEATLLVVAAGQASRKSVQGVLKRLQNAGGQIVGTVMNRFEVDSVEYRYMYRHSHYGYLGDDYTNESGKTG